MIRHRTVGYARVSGTTQSFYGTSLDDQERQLREAGCSKVYKEQHTGKTTSRPVWDDVVASLRSGDTLIVCKLDRIARSAVEGATAVKGLLDKGVSVHILNMGMVEDTPMGRMVMHMLFAFAEFERDMIAERTQAGIAARKAADPTFKVGRKPMEYDRNLLAELVVQNVRYGKPGRKCAAELGVAETTFRRWRDRYIEEEGIRA